MRNCKQGSKPRSRRAYVNDSTPSSKSSPGASTISSKASLGATTPTTCIRKSATATISFKRGACSLWIRSTVACSTRNLSNQVYCKLKRRNWAWISRWIKMASIWPLRLPRRATWVPSCLIAARFPSKNWRLRSVMRSRSTWRYSWMRGEEMIFWGRYSGPLIRWCIWCTWRGSSRYSRMHGVRKRSWLWSILSGTWKNLKRNRIWQHRISRN